MVHKQYNTAVQNQLLDVSLKHYSLNTSEHEEERFRINLRSTTGWHTKWQSHWRGPAVKGKPQSFPSFTTTVASAKQTVTCGSLVSLQDRAKHYFVISANLRDRTAFSVSSSTIFSSLTCNQGSKGKMHQHSTYLPTLKHHEWTECKKW